MDRRDFLKIALSAAAVPAAASLGGCAGAPVRPDGSPESHDIDTLLAGGARVLWCAAHPDDESMASPLIARAALHHRVPFCMTVLTHGEGGECCRPEGCKPDLATVRAQEMRQVAEFLRAELHLERYFNASLPVESFPLRHEIWQRWVAKRDPVDYLAERIRAFRPDIILTFDPDHGWTGHPEHVLVARATLGAVRAAVRPGPGGEPHRVPRTYHVLSRFWLLRMLGGGDPGPVTETFDGMLPCRGGGRTCLDVALRATEFHRTQANDMGTVRRFGRALEEIALRQADPFQEPFRDPAEPVTKRFG